MPTGTDARFQLRVSHADRVVTHSEHNAEALRGLGVEAEVLVVSHPPNLAVRQTPLPPRPPIELLFLGYVRPYKGLDTAIEAVRVLVDDGLDVRLTVAGAFWEPAQRYRDMVRRFGLQEHVALKEGFVPDDAVPALLERCHLLVLPYKSAGQSGVVPLAFAAGRPVVVTDVGGLPDQVSAGVNGELACAGDRASLADAIWRASMDLEKTCAWCCALAFRVGRTCAKPSSLSLLNVCETVSCYLSSCPVTTRRSASTAQAPLRPCSSKCGVFLCASNASSSAYSSMITNT